MNYPYVINQLGKLLVLFSAVMGALALVALLIDAIQGQRVDWGAEEALLIGCGLCLVTGGAAWLVTLRCNRHLGRREALLLVASSWVLGAAFAALGYTDVDTLEETFTVVGLHPAGGVKLFEVSGDSEDAKSGFALEEFSVRGDLALAVGDDTRRMYFDRIPSPDAKAHKERYRILFRQDEGDGELEYVFAGSDGLLIEKRYYEKGRKRWSASYYEYRRKHGKLYPVGIILEHHDYGYRLVVRLKEIRS